MSDIQKSRISKSQIGKKLTESHKIKISKAHKGKKVSKETKTKMSISHIGIIKTKKWRENLSKALKGRKHSNEHNKNVSIGTIKAMKNPIVREKLRNNRLKQVIPLKDTSIEISVQKELRKRKIKFKKHYPIIGQPDIFIEPNLCVFCDGDYWHNLGNRIKSDKRVNKKLKELGYEVIRFWEHQIREDVVYCVNRIEQVI
jgi:DNA mismatch endonuclease (patch repair protein)